MAKKGNRVQVILECTEQRESGVPGMSRYITTKNKKNTPERLERKKYNPYLKVELSAGGVGCGVPEATDEGFWPRGM